MQVCKLSFELLFLHFTCVIWLVIDFGGEQRNSDFDSTEQRLGIHEGQTTLHTSEEQITAHISQQTRMAQSSKKDGLMKEAEDALHKFDSGLQTVEQNVKDAVKTADKVITKEYSAVQNFLEKVLGGQERFWVRGPVDGQRLANNMLGWGAFGIAVHAWHRGIQQRPLTKRMCRSYEYLLDPIR
jgi:hypothetical protein